MNVLAAKCMVISCVFSLFVWAFIASKYYQENSVYHEYDEEDI